MDHGGHIAVALSGGAEGADVTALRLPARDRRVRRAGRGLPGASRTAGEVPSVEEIVAAGAAGGSRECGPAYRGRLPQPGFSPPLRGRIRPGGIPPEARPAPPGEGGCE